MYLHCCIKMLKILIYGAHASGILGVHASRILEQLQHQNLNRLHQTYHHALTHVGKQGCNTDSIVYTTPQGPCSS